MKVNAPGSSFSRLCGNSTTHSSKWPRARANSEDAGGERASASTLVRDSLRKTCWVRYSATWYGQYPHLVPTSMDRTDRISESKDSSNAAMCCAAI